MRRLLSILAVILGLTGAAAAQVTTRPEVPQIFCNRSVVYDAATNGATELVPLAAGRSIYVCGYQIWAGGTASVDLRYGTGTACGTGGTKLTPSFNLIAQTGVTYPSSTFGGMLTIPSNALCINASAGVAVQAVVFYSQF